MEKKGILVVILGMACCAAPVILAALFGGAFLRTATEKKPAPAQLQIDRQELPQALSPESPPPSSPPESATSVYNK